MIMKSHIRYLFFIFLIFILPACKKNENSPDNYLDKPNCISSLIPKTYDYQVVGFYPSWENNVMPVASIPWDKLTRIVYAFAMPNADGTMYTSDLVNTSQLADSAHAHGVEIYF